MRLSVSSFAEDIRPTAVIFIDLDNFKEVNDSFGHQAGDDCLERVVELIGSAVSKKGTLYRYGGDEFVVVLPNFESGEAVPTGERIRKSMDEERLGGKVKVTASIGIVCSDQLQPVDPKKLLEAADQAMYSAKRSGGNQVTIYAERGDSTKESATKALANSDGKSGPQAASPVLAGEGRLDIRDPRRELPPWFNERR